MGNCFGFLYRGTDRNPNSSNLNSSTIGGGGSIEGNSIMGNCFGSPNSSYVYSTTATQEKTREYSNDGRSSMTSSSAGVGPFISAFINGDILPTPDIREYDFADLKKATRNFKSDMVVGDRCFGNVYRGWVDETTLLPWKPGSGMLIAIKKLHAESTQLFDEWQAEVDFLGELSHPNLVKLLGYCWEGNVHAEPLPWDIQLKIAIGAARGLAFLHTYDWQVIYREFKTSNILLDGSYNAKLSDFGSPKLGHSGVDSYGYDAPEYIATILSTGFFSLIMTALFYATLSLRQDRYDPRNVYILEADH